MAGGRGGDRQRRPPGGGSLLLLGQHAHAGLVQAALDLGLELALRQAVALDFWLQRGYDDPHPGQASQRLPLTRRVRPLRQWAGKQHQAEE